MKKEAVYLRKIMNTKKSAESSDPTCYSWRHAESGFMYVTDNYRVARTLGDTPRGFHLVGQSGDYLQGNRRAKSFTKPVAPLPMHEQPGWNLPQDHDVAFTVDSDEVKTAIRAAKYLHNGSVGFSLDVYLGELYLTTQSHERGNFELVFCTDGYYHKRQVWKRGKYVDAGYTSYQFTEVTHDERGETYYLPHKPLLQLCVSSAGNVTVYAKRERLGDGGDVVTTALVQHTVGDTEFETLLSNRHKEG